MSIESRIEKLPLCPLYQRLPCVIPDKQGSIGPCLHGCDGFLRPEDIPRRWICFGRFTRDGRPRREIRKEGI